MRYAIGLLALLAPSICGFSGEGKSKESPSPYTTVNGTLKATDAKASTVTLSVKEGKEGSVEKDYSFSLDKETEIQIDGKKAALADLKTGDNVSVTYVKLEGGQKVKSVVITRTLPAATTDEAPGKAQESKPPDSFKWSDGNWYSIEEPGFVKNASPLGRKKAYESFKEYMIAPPNTSSPQGSADAESPSAPKAADDAGEVKETETEKPPLDAPATGK